jgi:peroxiredoxin Q/BCP
MVSLADLLARGPAIIYFYPADFTPACTAQACMVRDRHAALADRGATVAGISPQPPESHRRFAERHGLPFILLSDTDKSVARSYGAVWPLGIAVRRVTYMVDASGTVTDAAAAELNLSRHRRLIDGLGGRG